VIFFADLRAKKSWAQNGRKTRVKWAQIEGREVSKGNRINGNFAEGWGERWDLNPRPSVPQPEEPKI
jgi:hypothetical protein